MHHFDRSENFDYDDRQRVAIVVSPFTANILEQACFLLPKNDTPPIVWESLQRLSGADKEGFRDMQSASSETAQILGAIAYALFNAFDPETNISYREKYPKANTQLRRTFAKMLESRIVSRQNLTDVIQDVEQQCSLYEITLPRGRGRCA